MNEAEEKQKRDELDSLLAPPRVKLWEAINAVVTASGGNVADTSAARQQAVRELSKILDRVFILHRRQHWDLLNREATLDAISYRCADYDVELSQAESMTGERWPVNEGMAKAASVIDKLIDASGYVVKDRPEEDPTVKLSDLRVVGVYRHGKWALATWEGETENWEVIPVKGQTLAILDGVNLFRSNEREKYDELVTLRPYKGHTLGQDEIILTSFTRE